MLFVIHTPYRLQIQLPLLIENLNTVLYDKINDRLWSGNG